ncbi:MAG TPA: hypothetical protein VHA75_06700 [Rugosimonospora sp.]|nr:hypothetical protein [Rugosimonospora sp.]
MSEIDDLGTRHKALLSELEQLKPLLDDAIRAERETTGASYVDLMNRSGYKSTETIRQVLNPEARAEINQRRADAKARRKPHAEPDA